MKPRDKTRARKITLHDVARQANVSPMTVSNFINGKHQLMSAATRERVDAAVRQLNYRPQSAGRSLRYTRTFSVGMIIVDESPKYLSDGYTTHVVSGLGNALNEHGYTLQIEGLTQAAFEKSSLLRYTRTDAICMMLSGDDAARRAMIELAHRSHQPMIVFMEAVDPAFDDVCSVTQQDRHGGYELARHVLERGARSVMICRHSLNHWKPVEERCIGVADAIAEFDTPITTSIVECADGTFATVQASIAAAIERDGMPDAIMAMSDQIGIAALKLMRTRNVKVPDDMLITGFNAFDFWRYSELLLTTVRSPGYELGRRAGLEIVQRLESGEFSASAIELPVEMISGETT